jgi:hypothetical protein
MVQLFFYKDAFFVFNRPMIETLSPLIINERQAWLLDRSIRPGGSVVPQQIWFPGQGDWRRYVEQAQLRLPLFFINADGTTGIPVLNAAAGQMNLQGAHERAPFGDKITAKIRIAVCTQPHGRAHYLTSISQWPGYAYHESQIQLRDHSPARNPVSLERFVRHVGSRVRQYLLVSLHPDPGCAFGN